MNLALAFSLTLLAAVLISGFAHRSILSTSVLFLIVGFVLGFEPVGVLTISARDPFVVLLVEVALFGVLFVDGMRVGLEDLQRAWRLPGRALVLGMPIVMILTAALVFWFVDVTWMLALLVGAALSPTDPVFASAIVGREEVPQRLRRLLNVESGVNDGLALPVVVALTHIAGAEEIHYLELSGEILGGIMLGIVLPWLALRLEGTRFFAASEDYQPINAVAIGLLLFVLAKTLAWNPFLAAFAGGVTVATVGPEARRQFHEFGRLIAELLKLLTLLVFGALMSWGFLEQTTGWEIAFVFATLLFVRPVALGIALWGSSIEKREWIAAAWFGPKGFASVVFGMLILQEELAEGDLLFHLIGLAVAVSIIAHSSTDSLIADWFRVEDEPDHESAPSSSTHSENPAEMKT